MKKPKAKVLVWGAIAVGVVVVILLARRSTTSPTASTLAGDATGSGSGSGSSDAILQAKSAGFQTLAGLIGDQMTAQLSAQTTKDLANIQASIETNRNATTLAMAQIQADAEGRASAAALQAATLQTGAQASAAAMQTHSQESAQTLNFLSGVVNTVGQVVGAIIQSKKSGGFTGGGVSIGRGLPPSSGTGPGTVIDPSLYRGNKLAGFSSNDVRTH